ncbi:MAG: UDP-3-O-(3-hydroxymyristoyl)glucosamine N-acyltransferase [Legionella sp.]|uniref:UDP-3-O-(3-hydroxymyristoyl)glucosamine N-acyltransferase n=1 Tax=Legionella sp. TaxID=459 RepID=UPI0039E5BC95
MLTLAQLAKHVDGVWHGNAEHAIFSFASLMQATAQDISYYDPVFPHHFLENTAAGAVFLKATQQSLYHGNCIIVSDPLHAMMLATKYLDVRVVPQHGIDLSAQIHPSVQLGQNISIGALAIIGPQVQLADGVHIGANTVIEASVRIGKDSHIANNVVIHAGCQLRANIVVNSGCILGASPFNHVKHQGRWQQGPVVGSVFLADRVHLGANTVIDRGTFADTYLAEGVCIDNLVQVAHDVLIGKNTIIAGCAALGAHVRIGADCIIGGASSIAAAVHLADDVVITGMSTVSKSITKAGIYSSGSLAHEHQRWRRNAARFRRLDDYIIRLSLLEKKLNSIE